MNKSNVTLGFSFGLLLCAAMVLFQAQAEAPSSGGTSLTSTQVGYGSGTNSVTGEAAFTYNATTDTLTVPTLQTGTIRNTSGDQQLFFSTISGSSWNNAAGGAVNPMFEITNSNAVTTGRVLRIASGGTNHVVLGPGIQTDFTDSTGTPGAATINKAGGKSAIAAGASAVVITNSLVAATSRIFVNPTELDATCVGGTWIPVAGAGSFTVTATDDNGAAVNCTAATNFDWLVIQ